MNLQVGNGSIQELNQGAAEHKASRQGNAAAVYGKMQQGAANAAGARSIAAKDAFRLDLKGAGRTDTILGDGKKEAFDPMAEAGAADLQTQKDFMILASNTMSPEAYGKLSEEGFRPQEMDPEEIVDTVDQIKAKMAAAGKVIRGYNDDLSTEQLTQITGSAAYAAELERAFSEREMPLDEDVAAQAASLRKSLLTITALTDGAKNYLVENGLRPTAENLYLAAHSVTGAPGGVGSGYVQTGQYLGKTAAAEDVAALRAQTESLIRRAGDEVTQDRIETAERMLKQGVALTEENYLAMRTLDELTFPMTDAKIADIATCAAADGVMAGKADVSREKTCLEQAVETKALTDRITPEAVDALAESDLPLTLKNLFAQEAALQEGDSGRSRISSPGGRDSVRETAGKGTGKAGATEAAGEAAGAALPDERVITARRQVAEVRLTMTVEVNLRLIKQGVSLDTTELSRLVEDLKSMEKEIMQRRFEAKEDAEAALRSSVYDETGKAVSEIPGMPVSVVGDLLVRRASITTVTLTQYTETAGKAQLAFATAGERYETMMTVPRADLGDSLKSAFDRADSLMKELGIEASEENARAVRILGYNEMEITSRNIEAVKEAYRTVSDITERMTPAVTLQMIREGVNPMRLTLEELDRRLHSVTDGIAPTGEKYSDYLVRLEEKNAITSEEKESYIGIYRMLHQIGRHDTAAVGALLKQGGELSFSNLMTAVRSRRDRGMDISVDDGFGGMERRVTNGIDGQIAAAYEEISLREREAVPGPGDPAEGAREALEEAYVMGEYLTAAGELKEAADAPAEIFEELQQMGIPATAEHVLGLEENRRDPGSLHRNVRDAARRISRSSAGNMERAGDGRRTDERVADVRDTASGTVEESVSGSSAEQALEAAMADTLESFTSPETAQDAYLRMTGLMEQTVGEAMETGEDVIDVRRYSLMMKQIGVASALSKEESYDIPMVLEGEETTVNVRIVHEGRESADVRIHMETARYGHVKARFTASTSGLTGYTVCESEESSRKLSGLEEVLRERFLQEGIGLGELYFATSERAALNIPSSGTDEDSSGIDTTVLYRAAKIFLKTVGA